MVCIGMARLTTHSRAVALALVVVACGGAPPPAVDATEANDPSGDAPATPGDDTAEGDTAKPEESADTEFQLGNSDSARDARGASESKIQATKDQAAMKFFVVDKRKGGPIGGIVVSLTAPDGKKYYTEETDSAGYAEVLVPVGQKYELVYLSLGKKDIAARVTVTDEPNQNIKLTLRHKGWIPRKRPDAKAPDPAPRFVLKGVEFDTAKATIRPESFPRLDAVVEYMTHKKSSRIEISGHTDNVGKKAANKSLSQRRAEACRKYLISKGIDGSRIQAAGFGDEQPIASNDTAEGRQKNRRIEATEL